MWPRFLAPSISGPFSIESGAVEDTAALPAPVAYYPFDNSTADAGGNGYDLSGAVTYAAGKFGQANGNGFPSRANQELLAGALSGISYTVCFWWRGDGFSSSDVTFRTPDFTFYPIQVAVARPTGINVSYGDFGTTAIFTNVGGAFTENEWTHVAMTWAAGAVTVYRNGVQADATTIVPAGSFQATDTFMPNVAGGFSDPRMDELVVFGSVLTADQIALIAAGTQTIAQLAGL